MFHSAPTKTLVLLLCLLLTLSVSSAQSTNMCEVVLDTNLDVMQDARYGTTANEALTLPGGAAVEFVGRTPDGSSYVLRSAGNYLLSPVTGMLALPDGCTIAMWGAPPPNYRPLDEILRETGITTWQEAGYLGAGVRVGVLDARFDGLDGFIANGSLDAEQFVFVQPLEALMLEREEASSTEAFHGTNVLEVLTTIAPQAEYVIARAVSAEEFGQAVDALIGANVQIIVHAANVITPDSTPYHDAVRRAIAADILWVNSAGNIGAGYYPGEFRTAGRSPTNIFNDPNRTADESSLMVAVDPSRNARVSLVWGERPDDLLLDVYSTCQLDFETDLLETSDVDQASGVAANFESVSINSGELLGRLEDYIAPPTNGHEPTCVRQPDGVRDNEIYVSVADSVRTVEPGTRFDLYIEGALPAELDPDLRTSLDPVVLVPGDLPEVLTVGAFDPATNRMAWYSGRSNSQQYYELNNTDVDYSEDELVKPEIVTFGEILLPSGRTFFGTSAATPLVGGVATLFSTTLLPDAGLDTVRSALIEHSTSCLTADGAIGHVLSSLNLRAPEITLNNSSSTNCGIYSWIPDLASTYIDAFVEPSDAATRVELAQSEATRESLRLARLADQAFQSSQYDTAVQLSLRALAKGYTPEADAALVRAMEEFRGLGTVVSPSEILSLEISPDESYFITGEADGVLRVWDINNLEQIRVFRTTNAAITSLSFSEDGLRLVVGSDDGTACIVELTSLQCEQILIGHSSGVSDVEFVPDGSAVVTASFDGTIKVWHTGTGELERSIDVADFSASDSLIAVSSDGTNIALANDDHLIEIRDLQSGQLLHTAEVGFEDITAVEYLPDRNTIVLSTYSSVYRWDFEIEELSTLRELPEVAINGLGVLDSGSQIVVTGSANNQAGTVGYLEILDSTSGEQLEVFSSSTAGAVRFAHDRRLMLGFNGTIISKWSYATDPITAALESHDVLRVWAIAESPDNRYLVFIVETPTAQSSAELWVWDRQEERFVLQKATEIGGNKIDFISNDTFLAASGYDLVLWDLHSGEALRRFSGHLTALSSLDASYDGAWAITGTYATLITNSFSPQYLGDVRIWNLTTGLQDALYENLGRDINDVQFAPDGSFFLISANDTIYRGEWLENIQSQLTDLHILGGGIEISPDGSKLLVFPFGEEAYIYNLHDMELQQVLSGHLSRITVASFTSDGTRVVTAAGLPLPSVNGEINDNLIRVWDSETGELLREYAGHLTGVQSLTFLNDGNTIVSSDYSGRVKIWDIAISDLIDQACDLIADYPLAENEISLYGIDDAVTGCPEASEENAGSELESSSLEVTLPPAQYDGLAERRATQGHTSQLMLTVFSPDSSEVLSISNDGYGIVWDRTTGGQKRNITFNPIPFAVGYTPQGDRLVATHGYTVEIIDAVTGETLGEVMLPSQVRGNPDSSSIVFTPDSQQVLVATDTGVSIIDLATTTLINHLQAGVIDAIALSPSGTLIAGGGCEVEQRPCPEGAITIWDRISGEKIVDIVTSPQNSGISGHVVDVHFLSDTELISVEFYGPMKTWRLPDGILIDTNERSFGAGRLDQSRGIYWTAGSDITAWDIFRGVEIASFLEGEVVNSIDLSADGRFVVVGTHSHKVYVIDTDSFAVQEMRQTSVDNNPSASPIEEVNFETDVPTLTATVNADVTLNVRSGPSPDFHVVMQLSSGQTVSLFARNEDGSWVQIDKLRNWWVSSFYLTMDGNVMLLPLFEHDADNSTRQIILSIDATQSRTLTGLPISSGQTVTISYQSGSWRAGAPPIWPMVDAMGDIQVASKETFPVSTRPIMSLVCGIGDGQPIYVGTEVTFVASDSGVLWLGPNDDGFADNGGSLIVEVTISD